VANLVIFSSDTCLLVHNIVLSRDEDDVLVWTWNKENGALTTKLGYGALSHEKLDGEDKWWW
jgi:hypothetical protein